mmetsp:Transcript_14080/g.1264  ORF Transcript_14080/g.1264 Transcript_14080/m.1264 type:complete len:112 (+) Transcript_14080:79-414(+)
MGDAIKILLAVITCPCWWGYFSWLHNCCRTVRLTMEVFKSASKTLMKVLFLIVMFIFGFWIINLIFCIVSFIHIWGEPCKNFKSKSDILEAYHVIVYEKDCKVEGSIKGAL